MFIRIIEERKENLYSKDPLTIATKPLPNL